MARNIPCASFVRDYEEVPVPPPGLKFLIRLRCKFYGATVLLPGDARPPGNYRNNHPMQWLPSREVMRKSIDAHRKHRRRIQMTCTDKGVVGENVRTGQAIFRIDTGNIAKLLTAQYQPNRRVGLLLCKIGHQMTWLMFKYRSESRGNADVMCTTMRRIVAANLQHAGANALQHREQRRLNESGNRINTGDGLTRMRSTSASTGYGSEESLPFSDEMYRSSRQNNAVSDYQTAATTRSISSAFQPEYENTVPSDGQTSTHTRRQRQLSTTDESSDQPLPEYANDSFHTRSTTLFTRTISQNSPLGTRGGNVHNNNMIRNSNTSNRANAPRNEQPVNQISPRRVHSSVSNHLYEYISVEDRFHVTPQ